ncbi:MAG: tetratricopeptide repeat protein [Pseudomonadota bacterium]
MRRTINAPKRRLSALAATLLVSSALVACSSPEQRMEKFTNSGLAYLEDGDAVRAGIEFRNALTIDETHLPALQGLVDIAEQNREYQNMFGLLQRLIRLQPDNIEALVKMGNIYLLASDETEAEATAEKALAVDPDNLDAQALKASVFYKVGNRARAVEMAQSILAKEPTNRNAVSLIVADLVRQDRISDALAQINKGLATNEDNTLLQLMKIELLGKLGRDKEVDAVFKSLIASNPDDPSYQATYARYLVISGRAAEARAPLQTVVNMTPGNLENRVNLIRLDYQLGGAAKAEETFRAFTAADPDDVELQFAFADFLIAEENYDEAEAVFNRYAADRKDDALRNRAKVALAGLHITRNRRQDARTLIDEVLANDSGNTGALTKRAALLIEDQNYEDAIIDLRTVLGSSPDDTNALVLLSTAFEQIGDTELADQRLTLAFEKSDADPLVTNAYARFLIRNNALQRAERALSQSLSKSPDNVEGLRLLAAARLSLRDWQGAEEVARLLEEKASTGDTTINQIIGTAAIGRGDYESAIEQLSTANEAQPLSAQPLQTLISAYLEEGRNEDARTLLKEMITSDPDNYDARILLARVYFSENALDDAESALNESLRVAPERVEAYDLLYRYYLRSGRRPEAFALINAGLEKFPKNYGLKIFEADILMNEQRFDEAIVVYENLLSRRPDDRLVANNYVSLISDFKEDPQSLARAIEVAQTLRDIPNADFQDTVGWAYFRAGQPEQAAEILKRAVKNYPNAATLRYHLGATLLSLGDSEGARVQLKKSLELGGKRFRHAEKVRDLLKQA